MQVFNKILLLQHEAKAEPPPLMETDLFRQEFNKMFKWFANESSPRLLQSEIELHKKIWNFFILGDSYYFIDFISQLPVEKIMKYKIRYDIRFRKKMVLIHVYFTRD